MTRNIPILPYIIVKNDNFSITFGTTIGDKKTGGEKFRVQDLSQLIPHGKENIEDEDGMRTIELGDNPT